MFFDRLERPPLISRSVQDAIRDYVITQRLQPGDALPAETDSARDSGQPANEAVYQAQPISVEIVAREKEGYAIRPETPTDAVILQPGALLIVEGAERLAAGQDVHIVTLDQHHLEHLPEASGHQLAE